MEENTLDLNKNGGLTLEDVDFGEVEIVEDVVTPPATPPEPPKKEETPKKEEPEEKKTEPEPEPVKLDDLEFEDEEEESEEDEEKKKPGRPKKEDAVYTKLDAVRAVLKNKMDRYNIDSSEHNLEEMSEDDLAEFEETLEEAILESKWNNIKGQDQNLEKLLSYIESGGNPADITKLFQEQQEIRKIDISDESGQTQLVKSYYKDVLGWDAEKVANKIDRLKTSGSLEEEAGDVQVEYDKHFEKEQARKIEIQKQKDAAVQYQREQEISMFDKSLSEASIPKKQQEALKTLAFGEGVIKSTGEKMRVFDHRIKQIQSNPEMYLKLVQFMADPDGYEKAIIQGATNDKVTKGMKKGFQMAKSAPKPAAESTVAKPSKEKKTIKFNFN